METPFPPFEPNGPPDDSGRGPRLREIPLRLIIPNLITILAICLWAATVAAILPLALRRLRIDPAVSSAVFVTTCTDCLGFLSFLGLATLVGLGR